MRLSASIRPATDGQASAHLPRPSRHMNTIPVFIERKTLLRRFMAPGLITRSYRGATAGLDSTVPVEALPGVPTRVESTDSS